MPKSGHSLCEIPGFDPNLLAQLRDQLSVTTAEEFVGLWRSVPSALAGAVGGTQRAALLAKAAQEVLGSEEVAAIAEAERRPYPFATGHEPPPAGKKTF
jgi:hypothetical protein